MICRKSCAIGPPTRSPDRPTAAGLPLGVIGPARPADGFLGDGGALRLVHVDELAPNVCHAGDFIDPIGAVKIAEAGIAVRVHPAGIAG